MRQSRQVVSWGSSPYKGGSRFNAPSPCAVRVPGLFTIRGLSGLFLATLALGPPPHRRRLRRRPLPTHRRQRRHSLLWRRHFWWSKKTVRMTPEIWARIGAATIFISLTSPSSRSSNLACRERQVASGEGQSCLRKTDATFSTIFSRSGRLRHASKDITSDTFMSSSNARV
jgi:hypothetical protein